MRLTTRGRYAVTAMLDLALHGAKGPISLADISRRQGISLSYLEQLFSKLRKRQLVSSVRGPGGGYNIKGGLDNVNIADIIMAVNESIDATNCSGEGNCQDGNTCLTHYLWQDLSKQIQTFLSDISLADLVSHGDVRSVAERQDNQEKLIDIKGQLVAIPSV
jgi:Rrf2 family iron-sulfur cluster assembly transcriptional regulator